MLEGLQGYAQSANSASFNEYAARSAQRANTKPGFGPGSYENQARAEAGARRNPFGGYDGYADEGLFRNAYGFQHNTPPPPPPKAIDPCYAALGIKPDATEKEIRDAYRTKAKVAHPDQGGSEEKMKALTATRDRALKLRKANAR